MAREIKSEYLMEKLTGGLIRTIIEYCNDDHRLSLQIRDNYCNVYYRGSNIMRICPVKYEFDPFYYHVDDPRSKKDVMQDKQKVKDYNDAAAELIKCAENNQFEEYFKKASAQIDKWLKKHPKPERESQHKLIIKNTEPDSEYYILDIEFAVSEHADYSAGKGNPRFDIVAIGPDQQIYVFELKKGMGATDGDSGIKGHYEKFCKSIGGIEWQKFTVEMNNLLDNKKILHLVPNNISIDISKKPIFAFLFEDNYGEDKLDEFKAKVKSECNCVAVDVFKVDNKKIVLPK